MRTSRITGFNGFFPQIGENVWIDPFTGLIGNIILKAAVYRALP
jgi:hypothetical protein